MKIATEQETSSKIAVMSLICACLVALSHVAWNSKFGSGSWWFVRLTRFGICCMAVPFFFTVSGYFLSRHFDEKGWWRREVGKRFFTLAVPYLLWSALFFAFAKIGFAVLNAPENGFFFALGHSATNFKHILGLDFLGPPFLTPLWYVRALFILILFSPLVAAATRRRLGWLSVIGLFVAYYVVSPHRNGLRSSSVNHFFYYGISLFGAAYFCLGVMLRRTGIPVATRLRDRALGVFLFCAGVGLVVFRTYCISSRKGDPLSLLCFAIPLLVSGMWLALPAGKWPTWMMSLSFPIYVMHFFVTFALDGFMRVHGNKSIPAMMAAAAAAVVLPTAAAILIRRFWPCLSSVLFGGRGSVHGTSARKVMIDAIRGVAWRLWGIRWWIAFTLVLCTLDQGIRLYVLWPKYWLAVKLCIFYSSMSVAVALLLGSFARFVAPFFFSFWVLIEGLQCWTALNFHMVLSGNWVLILFSTSKEELSEFCGDMLSLWNVALAVLLLAAVAATFLFFLRKRSCTSRFSAISVLLALFFAFVSCMMVRNLFNIPHTWNRISGSLLLLHLPTDTVVNWKSYQALARASSDAPPYDLKHPEKAPLCIFVIGESLTRSHMSLYGYSRKTTPALDALRNEGGLVVFTDLTTDHSTTPEALCSLLTDGELGRGRDVRDVFPALLKKAGYQTSLVSCQGHWQAKDIVGTFIFRSCGEAKFLQGDNVPGTLPDEVALPEIKKCLESKTDPFALFIHLYGCHHPAEKRVPAYFKCQWPDTAAHLEPKARRKIDRYDTSVAYNDFIVSSIIRQVAELHEPSFVFYVSDHGESPDSHVWRDVKSRDVYEIPLLIWLSPEYRAAFPETAARVEAAKDSPLRQSHLMEGMLELAGVKGYPDGVDGGNFLSARPMEASPSAGKESR